MVWYAQYQSTYSAAAGNQTHQPLSCKSDALTTRILTEPLITTFAVSCEMCVVVCIARCTVTDVLSKAAKIKR